MRFNRFGKEVRTMGVIGLIVMFLPMFLPIVLSALKNQIGDIGSFLESMLFWSMLTCIFPLGYIIGAHFIFDKVEFDQTGIGIYAYNFKIKQYRWDEIVEIGIAENYYTISQNMTYIYFAKKEVPLSFHKSILSQKLKKDVIAVAYNESIRQILDDLGVLTKVKSHLR